MSGESTDETRREPLADKLASELRKALGVYERASVSPPVETLNVLAEYDHASGAGQFRAADTTESHGNGE